MSRGALRFLTTFLPMPPYSFITFPMWTTIILLVHSTLIVIFLSPLMFFFSFPLYVLTQVTPKEQAQDEYNWRGSNGTMIYYEHPPTKDYPDLDPWQETGVRLLPLEPRESTTWF